MVKIEAETSNVDGGEGGRWTVECLQKGREREEGERKIGIEKDK